MNTERYKNGNASRNFEQLYKPGDQQFNLDKKRERNIKEINEIINEFDELDYEISKEKRKVVANTMNDNSLSDVQKNKTIDEEFEKLEVELEVRRRKIRKKLNETINKQAKFLLVLKKPEDVYKYYKLMLDNPLQGK
ncbi:MAG: hypothetical protein IJ094_01520 [Bacilli bacterium]|nr:hypothetical protein [Bacilli bacterium]